MNFTFKRILLSFVLGFTIAIITTEVGYYFFKRENREPTVVEIVIPSGTAEKIREGEAPPDIPDSMTFVVGDILKVVNQDNEDHTLGPLWIPAGASASLSLDSEQNLAFECSFQPTKYFGLNVQQPVTWGTRLAGILFAGLPLSFVIAVYSGLIGEKKENKTE